ncbi:MAG: HEAT repeat domain-containing protein, partial [Roseiflexaceae bacterium]|nr:HEAT repeat domain-containing protein [Roseiflexaceae bacterium]
MVALNVVQRLRHTNDLRTYRKKLVNEFQQSVLLRTLPALLDAPLLIVGIDGTPRHLDDTVEQAGYVVLCGGNGSGRTLALQQLAQHWLADDRATPLLIALPSLDDGRKPPITLLAEAVGQAAQVAGRAPKRSSVQGSLPERLAGWALLITSLEELPAQRQQAWREALQAAPQQWPETQVVVEAARDESRWPGFTTLTIAAASEQNLERWLELLVPADRRALLAGVLRAGSPLAPLGERVFDVALLAIVVARSGVPHSRAHLYDAAFAVLFDLARGRDDAQLNELQLLAAYDERPAKLVDGLIEPNAVGEIRFVAPLLRSFLAAQQLVAEQRYDLLGALEAGERREIARFCSSIAADTGPLFAAIWGAGRPEIEDVLTLGNCLRECADTPPNWTIRIIGALAVIARDGRPPQRTQALLLLRQCRAALNNVLDTLAEADERSQQVIPQLLALLPQDLALGYAEQMIYSPAVSEALAWSLADVLVSRAGALAAPNELPADPAAQVRWLYVQALRSHASRAHLVERLAPAELRLASSRLDSARLLQVAAVLIEDSQLPTEHRIAGLALLGSNDQPTALTVIERACYDESAPLRQAALAALAARDASRGQTALSRAAIDQEAPSDTRIGAIEQLTTSFGEESQPLLARFAHDISLPLYAQLLSVAALAEAASGQFAAIVRNEHANPTVRALAAARLSGDADTSIAPLLCALLADPATPRELAIGICAGITTLGHAAIAPLLDQLTHAQADIELTESIAIALGKIGDDAAIPVLDALLTGAFERLNGAIPPHLRDALAADAASSGELPEVLLLHLELAQMRAPTLAESPTTLREFLADRADTLRRAAADALAMIGGNSARAALMAALIDDACGTASDHVVATLARTGEGSAEALGHLLEGPEINPLLRWMAVQHLCSHAQGEGVMHRALARTEIDAFTRGALAEALGQRGTISALPVLRQIADDPQADLHLRSQAIIGLGALDEPATEVVLMRLLADSGEDQSLRGLAAEHLPSQTSAEGRRLLRDILRRERQPEVLAAGVLRALGRMRDREALPLLLRFAQDERGEVARAGLEALAALDDGSVAPVLVRV